MATELLRGVSQEAGEKKLKNPFSPLINSLIPHHQFSPSLLAHITNSRDSSDLRVRAACACRASVVAATLYK